MNRTIAVFAAVAVLASAPSTFGQNDEETREDRWADAMARFEQSDGQNPPQPGGAVFVGSSSIRLWDLAKSFPDIQRPLLNRGFGGSQLEDSIRHAELLILKHEPRLVVVYAGDNDVAAGKTADRVANDFKVLAALIKQNSPEARIAYIAIKPSIARWNLAETMFDANRKIAEICADDERLAFVDIWDPMLGDDGQPRKELFAEDGLHLSDNGYELWAKEVRPLLKAVFKTDGPAKDVKQ